MLLSYGAVSAGSFLYKYGWLPEGCETPNAAKSEHDCASVAPLSLWATLRPAQLEVVRRHDVYGIQTKVYRRSCSRQCAGTTCPPQLWLGTS